MLKLKWLEIYIQINMNNTECVHQEHISDIEYKDANNTK